MSYAQLLGLFFHKSANACAGSEFEKQVIGMTPVLPSGVPSFTRIFRKTLTR